MTYDKTQTLYGKSDAQQQQTPHTIGLVQQKVLYTFLPLSTARLIVESDRSTGEERQVEGRGGSLTV